MQQNTRVAMWLNIVVLVCIFVGVIMNVSVFVFLLTTIL